MAAVNGPSLCVASGGQDAIRRLDARLAERNVRVRPLITSHALHSSLMEPALEPFAACVARARRHARAIPFLSNVTGTWITEEQAADPGYWALHLRSTVRFAAGVQELLSHPASLLLEVGPGRTLSTLAESQTAGQAAGRVLASMRHPQQPASDVARLLEALGRLWVAGVTVDWVAFHADERRRRIPLPTYPFEPERHGIGTSSEASPRTSGGSVPMVILIHAATKSYPTYPPGTSALRRGILRLAYICMLEYANLRRQPRGNRLAHVLARGRRVRDRVQARLEGG